MMMNQPRHKNLQLWLEKKIMPQKAQGGAIMMKNTFYKMASTYQMLLGKGGMIGASITRI